MSKPRVINELLRSGEGGLPGLLARARRIQKLDTLLASALQPELASQVRAAGLEARVLKLITPSASIATRIRLDAAELIRALEAGGSGRIDHIDTLIAPLPTVTERERRPRKLSRAAQEALDCMKRSSSESETE